MIEKIKKYKNKIAAGAFLFFFIKGLIWLLVGLVTYLFYAS